MLLSLPDVWVNDLVEGFPTDDLPFTELAEGIYLIERFISITFNPYHFSNSNIVYPYDSSPLFEGAIKSIEKYLDDERDILTSFSEKYTIFISRGDPNVEVIKWNWGDRDVLRPIPVEWRGKYFRIRVLKWNNVGLSNAWQDSIWPILYDDYVKYES